MAKYRHRTFEMYDFREEAFDAIAAKSVRDLAFSEEPSSWTFGQLSATRQASVTHVTFKKTNLTGAERLEELRKDFLLLAKSLVNDSRVVLDFEGVEDFSASEIEALADLYQKLKSKGSRIALCNLDPAVQASFFPTRK